MSKRDISKIKTRENILKKTALLFKKVGFLNVSTKTISQRAKVSQGTVFLHFKTKEKLLVTIIENELEIIEKRFEDKCIIETTQLSFVKSILDLFIDNEIVLSRLFIDYRHLPIKIKNRLNEFENSIRNNFYENIRYSSSSKINIMDTFISIESFMAQIFRYLNDKDFKNKSSIIKEKRGRLLKLNKILFG